RRSSRCSRLESGPSPYSSPTADERGATERDATARSAIAREATPRGAAPAGGRRLAVTTAHMPAGPEAPARLSPGYPRSYLPNALCLVRIVAAVPVAFLLWLGP